jgi:hypothetical protein
MVPIVTKSGTIPMLSPIFLVYPTWKRNIVSPIIHPEEKHLHCIYETKKSSLLKLSMGYIFISQSTILISMLNMFHTVVLARLPLRSTYSLAILTSNIYNLDLPGIFFQLLYRRLTIFSLCPPDLRGYRCECLWITMLTIMDAFALFQLYLTTTKHERDNSGTILI